MPKEQKGPSPSPIRAETMALFLRRKDGTDRERGTWFGQPVSGLTVSGPGIPEAPFYFVTRLSGVALQPFTAMLQVESPSGKKFSLRKMEGVFDQTRTMIVNGEVKGFSVDGPGEYALRLIINDVPVAQTTFMVTIASDAAR
jgi:hypothetical protein